MSDAHRDLCRRLYLAQVSLCSLCRKPMAPGPYRRKTRPGGYTEEHVRPRRDGGHRGGNVLLAHERCNTRKGGRDPTEAELALLADVYVRLPAIP